MESLLGLAREYGWLALLIVFVLVNAGKIAGWLERSVAQVWPAMAEARQARMELEAREKQIQLEQACALYEELVATVRSELEEERAERKATQGRLYQLVQRHEQQMAIVVERYEQHMAASVEVLRDLSDGIREHSRRLDSIERCIEAFHTGDISRSHRGETRAAREAASPGPAPPS